MHSHHVHLKHSSYQIGQCWPATPTGKVLFCRLENVRKALMRTVEGPALTGVVTDFDVMQIPIASQAGACQAAV